MQNYLIKPGNVGGQNQPEESTHFSIQASSLMDIDDHAETDIQSVVVDETHYNRANVEPKINDDDVELKTDEDRGIEPKTDDDDDVESQTNDDDDVEPKTDNEHNIPIPSKNISSEIFVVSSVIGKSISHQEKLDMLNKQPCQPSKDVLSKRKKRIGNRDRCCSEGLFRRKDGSKRSWLTYSLENDSLFCTPCMLFSDSVIRGQGQRKNQGNAFIKSEFSNWKKQFEYVQQHEESQSHINAKIAQVMFLQKIIKRHSRGAR